MRLFLLFFVVPATCRLACPPEYHFAGGKKCLKVHWEEVHHLEAEDSCRADGGTLVTIKSAQENQIVVDHANTANLFQFWIGLYCPFNSANSCVWDDNSGSLTGYNNFYDHLFFDGIDHYDKCVTMETDDWMTPYKIKGKWELYDCNSVRQFAYICEVPITLQPNVDFRLPYNFNGFQYRPSLDFEFEFEPPRTFEEVKVQCVTFDGFLASIHSNMEVDYVRKIFRGTGVSKVFIGAERTTNGRYTWFDGSNWDFEYFDPLDPNTNSNATNCIAMDVQNHGLWYHVECTEMLEYLCKSWARDDYNEFTPSTLIPPPLPDLSLSNCNSTLLVGPGSISTFGFPSVPQSSCTWNIMVLGPYRVGLFFEKWETSGIVKIHDEYEAQVAEHGGQFSTTPFSEILNCNSAKVTFQPVAGSAVNVDKGFHAVVLPI